MIETNLFGGIGNQLFQFLAGIKFSKKKKTKAVYSFKYKTTFSKIHKSNIDDVFELEYNFKKKYKYKNYFLILKKNIHYFFLKFNLNIFFINEKNFFYSKKKNELFGYFQDQKFFPFSQTKIIKLLNFKKKKKFKRIFRKVFKKKNLVSIHIRRGDYIYGKSLNTYNILNYKYYFKAIKIIKKKIKRPHFLVFSDDLNYTKKFFSKNFKSINYDIVDTKNDDENLYLMTKCHHNIIANSTFSWWGAYLNKNKNKIVISPKYWFKKSFDNKKNKLIDQRWILI